MVSTTHTDHSRSAPPTFGEMFRASPWLFLDGMVLISAIVVAGAFIYFYEDPRKWFWQALGYGWIPVGLWAASVLFHLAVPGPDAGVSLASVGSGRRPGSPLHLWIVLLQPRPWPAGRGLPCRPLGNGSWRPIAIARRSGQDAGNNRSGSAGVLPPVHWPCLLKGTITFLALAPTGRRLCLPGAVSGWG